MNTVTLIQFDYEKSTLPLGALYLASGLEKQNIQFDLKLYPLHKKGYLSLNKLYSFFVKTGDIVAIGCWSDMLPYVICALKELKYNFPNKTIILGGIGPTIVAENLLNKYEFIDFIIKGCGVIPLPKLINKLTNVKDISFDHIERLVFRKEGKIFSNCYDGYYLNTPDFPAYHRISNLERRSLYPIITSFGCPYKCTYCDTRPVSPKVVIYRDIQKIIEEIKLIKRLNGKNLFSINILDEAFTVNRKRVIRFCNLLRKEKLNIPWGCFGRVDTIDEEILKIMAKNGCKGIYYGVESGSNRILKKIRKGFTVEEAIEKILLSKKHIGLVFASFIFMFPFERAEDFKKTLVVKNALRSKKICVQLFPLTPVKNSELYQKYGKTLKFSLGIPNYRLKLDLPKEVLKLIKGQPDIFFNFYHYYFRDLREIVRLYNIWGNREFAITEDIQAFLNQFS